DAHRVSLREGDVHHRPRRLETEVGERARLSRIVDELLRGQPREVRIEVVRRLAVRMVGQRAFELEDAVLLRQDDRTSRRTGEGNPRDGVAAGAEELAVAP